MPTLNDQGWALGTGSVDPLLINQLVEFFSNGVPLQSGRGGRRDILDHPLVRELVADDAVRSLVDEGLGAGAFACRAILFDKTPESNWKVTWHQDRTIAVRERKECSGFGPWSSKAGVPHVEAPRHVLENVLAVRVHLDVCGVDNGPLQVLPGSHLEGKLSPEQVDGWKRRGTAVDCLAARGDVLVFRPLLLHHSSKAVTPAHRRVAHIEFAAAELPGGLEWAARSGVRCVQG